MAESVRDTGLPAAGPVDQGPVVADLLADLREVWARLGTCVRLGHVLDAFLFAAGAVQIVEDHVQRDPLSLRRTAKRLGGPAGRPLAAVADALDSVRATRPAHARALAWCAGAAAVRDLLADALVGGRTAEETRRYLRRAVPRLRDDIDALPRGLDEEVLRLPACFRGHGLLPADAVTLAAEYGPSAGDREVLVVGVRTSGSYLGPLVAAALRASGTRARAISTRPARPLLPGDARAVAEVLGRGGVVAVVDDPPNTGGALRDSAGLLEAHGAARDAITLLVPLFGDEAPATLDGYRRVELSFRRWAVHELLEPQAVAATLTSLWGETVTAAEHVADEDGEHRDHVTRHHLTRVVQARLRSGERRRVVVTGAGVGYLGRFALAVAAAVPGHVATIHGFRNGLVYREWLPGSARVRHAAAADAGEYARYVADRAAAMPAARDRAVDLAGREPVWELASRLLQRGYGRFGLGLRLPLLDRAARRLCAAAVPSVIDGATGLSTWFRVDGGLRKIRADDLAFGNLDHTCYDPVYDLAGVDPGSPDGAFVAALRAAHPTDPERFLLYELVHLQDPFTGWSRDRRASARAVQRYLAEVFPAPAPETAAGPLCALDLDGVLESLAHGFPVPTPMAVRAVRALAHHGFRPVPVTGRSLAEVRDRCATLDLAGGVAEYGAVAYERAGGRTVQVVSDGDREVLDRLREALRRTPGVRVDDDYRYSVRAYRGGDGWRSVRPEALEAALAALGGDRDRLRVVPGRYQTDITAAGVDKGTGLRVLARLLGTDTAVPVRLAVGDTAADLPMLALAEQAYAPANAAREVRDSGVTVLRRPYAAGVDAAVARVLGHRPGRCATCRPARHTPATRLLLTILDAPRAGRAGLPAAALRLAVAVAGAGAGHPVPPPRQRPR